MNREVKMKKYKKCGVKKGDFLEKGELNTEK